MRFFKKKITSAASNVVIIIKIIDGAGFCFASWAGAETTSKSAGFGEIVGKGCAGVLEGEDIKFEIGINIGVGVSVGTDVAVATVGVEVGPGADVEVGPGVEVGVGVGEGATFVNEAK